jgi:clan AA aspartic protease
MGRFSVKFEIANNDDLAAVRRGDLGAKEVRRMTITGVVDSGASRLVLPKHVVEQLGLLATDQVKVKYADGRVTKRPVVGGVYVKLQGRDSVFKATVEPKRETALIGALVLEDLDFLIDPLKERLVPRDPDFIVSEIDCMLPCYAHDCGREWGNSLRSHSRSAII